MFGRLLQHRILQRSPIAHEKRNEAECPLLRFSEWEERSARSACILHQIRIAALRRSDQTALETLDPVDEVVTQSIHHCVCNQLLRRLDCRCERFRALLYCVLKRGDLLVRARSGSCSFATLVSTECGS